MKKNTCILKGAIVGIMIILIGASVTPVLSKQLGDNTKTKNIGLDERDNLVHNINTSETFATIQAAINDPDTQDGQTLVVDPGIYCEHVIVNKSLTLLGINKDSIIDGNLNGHVVTILADHVTLQGFTIEHSGTGFIGISIHASYSTIIGNTISNNGDNVCIYYTSNITIVENLISDTLYPYSGIYLHYANWTNISGNTLVSNNYGMQLYHSDNNTIGQNNITNTMYEAIRLYSSNRNAIVENTIYLSIQGCGIFFSDLSYWNTISKNTVSHVNIAIGVGGENNNITDNILGNNRCGITLHTARYNIVAGNTVGGNAFGISIEQYAYWNTIRENTIEGNTECGILVFDHPNYIYHNNFVNNHVQTYNEWLNQWDDGYPSGGNYWSDYTGTDLYQGPNQDIPGSDGIGDTPYNINGADNQDHYPFMEENGWLLPQPPTTPIHVSDGCHTHDHPNDMNKGIGKLPCFVQPPHGVIQTFSTTSSNTGQIYYKFFYGDGTNSSWLGPYTSGQIATATHDYNNIGIFQVTAIAKVGTTESLPSTPLSVRMYKCGDLNGDNLVDFGDINPFVSILTNSKAVWYNQFPNGYWWTGDINNDCNINFGDINPFVQELTSCPP